MRVFPREILATFPKRVLRGLNALDPRTVRLKDPAPRFKKLLWAVDPRTVRLKEPTSRLKRNGLIAVAAAAFLGAGAVAVASTGSKQVSDPAPSPAPNSYSQPEESYDPGPPVAVEPVPVQWAEPKKKEEPAPVPKPQDFYNPIYVFTDEPANKVNAYPLKEPPGIVVNLDGTPEPEVEAKEMVGEDSRVRSVRRRTTSTGIRYIIGLKTPIKRIKVVPEGNVVMIAPLE